MPRVTAPTEPGIEKINVFEFTPASARDAIALVPISSVKERYLKISPKPGIDFSNKRIYGLNSYITHRNSCATC